MKLSEQEKQIAWKAWHNSDVVTEGIYAAVEAVLAQRQPAQPEAQPTPGGVVKNRSTEKGREFWDHVDSVVAQTKQPVPDVIERMLCAWECTPQNESGIIAMTAAAQVLLDEVEQVTYDVVLDWSGDARNAEDVSKNVRARLTAKSPLETGCNNSSGLSQTNVPQCTTPTIPEWEKALFEEWCDKGSRVHYDKLIKGIRARLAAKPPQQDTREQQVTAILQETVRETNDLWVAAAEKIARLREASK